MVSDGSRSITIIIREQIMENLDSKGQSPDKHFNAISSMITPPVSESESEAMVITTDIRTSWQLDKLKERSHQCYMQSNIELYRAIGYAYIWFHRAKTNSAYLDKAFDGLSGRSSNGLYLKTVKYCFGISDDRQASSVSKYAKAMMCIEEQLGFGADAESTDQFVDEVVELISSGGGVDKFAGGISLNKSCSAPDTVFSHAADTAVDEDVVETPVEVLTNTCTNEAAKATDVVENNSPGKPLNQAQKLTREYFDIKKREYVASSSLGSFKFPQSITTEKSGLVVMVGVVDGSSVNVVEVLPNDDVLEALIKAEAKRSSASPKGEV